MDAQLYNRTLNNPNKPQLFNNIELYVLNMSENIGIVRSVIVS